MSSGRGIRCDCGRDRCDYGRDRCDYANVSVNLCSPTANDPNHCWMGNDYDHDCRRHANGHAGMHRYQLGSQGNPTPIRRINVHASPVNETNLDLNSCFRLFFR